ncbi:hypothetical protein ACEWY4_028052 [Coilia grayii]|uniref:Uncharacterized protein n=1 Tax=Coilia grayii TaxID=363190 RepID=A0ABD1IQ85_9TELE
MPLRLQNRYEALSTLQGQGESGPQVHNTLERSPISLQLTKKYFKLLQAVHHIEILDRAKKEKQLPPGMTRQIHKLTKFIKPACPNQTTTTRVTNITNKWMVDILEILLAHYESTISDILEILEEFDLEALNKAINWAKSRYRKKFTNSSVDKVKDLLQPETIDNPPRTSSPIIPVTSRQRLVKAQVIRSHNNSQSTSLEPELSVPLATSEVPTQPPLEDHSTQASSGLPRKVSQIEQGQPSLVPPTVLLKRLPCTNTAINTVMDAIMPSPTDSDGLPSPPQRPSSTRESEGNRAGMIEPSLKVNNQTNTGSQSESTSFSQRDADVPLGPPPKFRPVRHTRAADEFADWSLTIHKPLIFIGDSNLSRIPSFSHPNIQVDSFPGAAFHHLTQLVGDIPNQNQVELVVISAGIINCNNLNDPQTPWKQYQNLHCTCQSSFPNALIYISQISWSPLLHPDVIGRIKDFNSRVEKKVKLFLPTLDPKDFQVNMRDKIHWHKRTAETMFQYCQGQYC